MNTPPLLQKKVMLSAIQPSNQLTLGNYLGALKNWVKLQDDYFCIFFAVDLHALTVRQDPTALREQTYLALASYIASGIRPEDALLFVQSHVAEHAELGWIFNCFVYTGELSRMTQFKDKSAKQGQNISAGLFTYPALMASDILLYQTHLVPVGEDQKQHIEITRDIATRMNHIYGEGLFTIPEIYSPPVGARIMSLQNPKAKMSKSDPDPHSAVYLVDTNDQILKKLKRAVTDSGSEITPDDSNDEQKPGIQNLLQIQAALLKKTPQEVARQYAGKQYGHLKVGTAELIIETLGPIRDRTQELMKDKSYLDSVLQRGAKQARERAQKTLTRVHEKLGLVRGRYS